MSLGKDKYYKAKGVYEGYEGGESQPNMRGIHGEYVYTKDKLAAICNLDNHHSAGLKDFPNMILSSQMIVETYGGQEGIMTSLFTNPKTGIEGSANDIRDRQRIYGPNEFAPPHIKGIMELIMENFEDRINQILLGAALVSLVIGLYKEGFPEGLIEGTSIAIALVIIISVTSINNYISEKRLAELVALSEKQEVAVCRGGSDKAVTIDATQLVVGDLVKFTMGEKVPADMMMVDGQDVTCNESELTGEPDSLEKNPVTDKNYRDGIACTMLAKSLIDGGVGKAIVMAVGPNTVAGVITEKVQTEGTSTLLQQKLDVMAGKIGNIGLAVAIGTFIANLLRIIIETLGFLPCGCQNMFICKTPVEGTCTMYNFADINNEVYPQLLESVIIAITVVVVAIPEGLPLAVTISLSFSSAKMQKLNNLVRKIASSETMGGATHICSDKTGTLTLNKMTVMATMAAEKVVQAQASGDEIIQVAKSTFSNVNCNGQTIWDTMLEGILWNSSAWIEANDGKDPNITDEYVTKGNVTEQGIMKFFMNSMGTNFCIGKKADLTEDKILCVVPFTSKRKMGSIVVRQMDKIGTDKEVRVYCKGAPDMLLQKVTYAITREGTVQPINRQTTVTSDLLFSHESAQTSDTYRGLFDRTVKKFADQAYRTILVTYKDMSMREFQQLKHRNNQFAKEADREILESDLISVGLFGLQDPLRPTIVDSIIKCNTAGIQVIMCTGDNIDTAIAISKNAGIVTADEVERNEYSCMTGKNFREAVGGLKQVTDGDGKEVDVVADMQKFREIKKQLKVLARSSPEDKYLLVTGIQDCEGVVAVTGDGTNDAPALTKADVGFAMGITGTDVAKGASDIILLDDNFSSIIVALKYGRNVYDNVRKFLQFQLTVNYVAMFIVFLGAVVTKKTPLNAVQMLWVNLIMDTFAALALATEPPPPDILERQPYAKNAPIITDIMSRNVQGHAIYQMIILLVILFSGPNFLIDHPYELQCTKYKENGQCDTMFLNPFYTLGEYYQPVLWKPFTDASDQHLIEGKKKLKNGYAFDKKVLYSWRCNMFTQDNPGWSDSIESMGLCFIDEKELNDPNKYHNFMTKNNLDEESQKIVKSFAESGWHQVDPATTELMITEKNGEKRKYTSRGKSTEETKLFSFVFNTFVFMQVFNQINARKLEAGEFNVFSGIIANFPFIGVVIVTIIVQLLMVEFGGRMVKCWPLNLTQNFFCIGLGAIELIWGVFIKFIPTKFFYSLSLEDKHDDPAPKKYISTAIKGKSPAKK